MELLDVVAGAIGAWAHVRSVWTISLRCCVCHAAQWQIACLPVAEKSLVDWFLTEDRGSSVDGLLARTVASPR